MSTVSEETICPGCGARGAGSFLAFFSLQDVPVNSSALVTSATAARACRRGQLALTLCHACGLIFNRRFDASRLDYDEAYDNALDYSPTFQAYAQGLAQRLMRRHELRNKRIIEIGSGRGKFLELLCADGTNQCVGYDPTFDPSTPIPGEVPSTIRFVQDYYAERYAGEPIDFLVCRHVLEHMPEPLAFLTRLRGTLATQGEVSLYFEVPNALQVLDGPALWDVIYQHVLYFTADSLEGLFQRAGFELIDSGLAFGEQYLWVEARTHASTREAPSRKAASSLPIGRLATEFGDRFRTTLARWAESLGKWTAEDKRLAFWGAGTKGVTFLNVVDGARNIGDVVDVNPRKQGMYVPGTGQRISAPDALTLAQPAIVITLNPAYVKEIAGMLSALHVPAEIVTLSSGV